MRCFVMKGNNKLKILDITPYLCENRILNPVPCLPTENNRL